MRIALIMGLITGCSIQASASEVGITSRIDLVVRAEVLINAAPQAIWPKVKHFQLFLHHIISLRNIAGPTDGIGEVLEVTQQVDHKGSTRKILLKTVEQTEYEGLVQKVYPPAGQEYIGYESTRLEPVEGGRTRVIKELYLEGTEGSGSVSVSEEELHRREMTARRQTQTYLQAGLERIKRQLESLGTTPDQTNERPDMSNHSR